MDRKARVARIAMVLLAAAVALPACRGGGYAVSSDPAAPVYRNPAVDLSQVKTVVVHYASVTTNNNQGADLVQQVFNDSLKIHLGRRFGSMSEGAAAPADGAILHVTLVVNWGSRAARMMVGWGAGKTGIDIKYEFRDAAGGLIAKMHAVDSMSSGADSRELVYAAASKWNTYFVDTVLGAGPAPAK